MHLAPVSRLHSTTMRWLLLILMLSGCYPHLMPTDPVADPPAAFLGTATWSDASYEGKERLVEHPVVPFRMWGLDFDEEVLFELAHDPTYAMVELTRAIGRDGEEVFFALVAESNGVQHVVVGDERAAGLASTFPAPVHDGKLRVVRLEGDGAVEYDFAFYLPDGRLLQANVSAKNDGKAPDQRVGNAMNHSADRVLAVLDLEESNWGKAAVFIEEKRATLRHLAVVLPFVWRLQQTAGGMSFGGVNMAGSEHGLLESLLDGTEVPMVWREEPHGDEIWLVGRDRVIDHVVRFKPRTAQGWDGPVEIVGARVMHGDVQVVDFAFNPALPDLRYPVTALHEARMVAGANGRAGYMRGVVRTQMLDGRATVDFVPEVPFWACERPVRNRLQLLGDRVRLRAEVTPALAVGGLGRDACYDYDAQWRKER